MTDHCFHRRRFLRSAGVMLALPLLQSLLPKSVRAADTAEPRRMLLVSNNLGVNIDKANRSLAWTRDGVLLPAEDKASALFQKMFVQGDAAAVQTQLRRLEERGSILDTLLDDTKQVRERLGRDDQSRLDQYLTSVREIEQRLHTAREWELRPKPTTTHTPPTDIHDQKLFFEKFDLMLSMSQLALESDSTRIITLMVDAFATPSFKLGDNENSTTGYHDLSHHGQHLAFSHDNNRPLCNLFVTMLQNMGLETDAFGSSTGTLNEINR